MERLTFTLFLALTGCFSFAQDLTDEDQYMDAFVLIADTSRNYYDLRSEMFVLSEKLDLQIDTMGRGFDEEQKLIALPHDDEDEIYAGDYLPRRSPSGTLSLEYLRVYTEGNASSDGTIALIAAITPDRAEADQLLAKVRTLAKDAYILPSRIYMGCMH